MGQKCGKFFPFFVCGVEHEKAERAYRIAVRHKTRASLRPHPVRSRKRSMGGGTRTTRVEGDDERNGRIENEEQLEELKAFITNEFQSNFSVSWEERSNETSSIVSVENTNNNKIRIEDLGETDNVLFSKLAVAFSSLYVEAKRLEKLSRNVILPNVISFGWCSKERERRNKDNKQEESKNSINNAVLAQFTKKLTMLQDSVMFRDHLKAVAVNAFRQLEFQYADESVEEKRPLSHVNLTIVFETLTMCLATACKIDEAVASNGHLRRSFQAIKVALKEALEEEDQQQQQQQQKKKLLALKKTIQTLEFELCSKSCFETIVREIVDEGNRRGSSSHSKKNAMEEVPMRLLRALHAYGLEMFEVDCVVQNDVGILALGVLLVRLEPKSSDMRLIEKILKHIFSEKVVGLVASTGIVIDPLHFLMVQLSESVLPSSKKKWQTHLENKIVKYNDMNAQLATIIVDFIAEVTSWTSEFERDNDHGKVSLETLTRGIRIARDIKASLELFLHLDNTFSKDAANEKEYPENKRRARMRAYGQLAELLETIRVCYVSRQNELALEVKRKIPHTNYIFTLFPTDFTNFHRKSAFI